MSDCKPYIPTRIYENPTAKCNICNEPQLYAEHNREPIQVVKTNGRIFNHVRNIMIYLFFIYILTKLIG